jgi:hypothetical protein
MLKRALVSAVAMGVALTVAACGSVSSNGDDASDAKWGVMAIMPWHLVKKPNGATISMCGADLPTLQWAINEWGSHVGKTFRFVVYNDTTNCANVDILSIAASTSYAQEQCGAKNWTNTMFMTDYARPMTVVDCGGHGQLQEGFLHEAGHLWGLCDQYNAKGMSGMSNCVSTTAVAPGSVMSGSWVSQLTDDDITGIRGIHGLGPATAYTPPAYNPPAYTTPPAYTPPVSGEPCLTQAELSILQYANEQVRVGQAPSIGWARYNDMARRVLEEQATRRCW